MRRNSRHKVRRVGFFEWLALINELYHTASRVTTMTIRNPKLPSAITMLRLALNKVNKAQAILKSVEEWRQ